MWSEAGGPRLALRPHSAGRPVRGVDSRSTRRGLCRIGFGERHVGGGGYHIGRTRYVFLTPCTKSRSNRPPQSRLARSLPLSWPRSSHLTSVVEQSMRSVAGSLVLLAATAPALLAQPAPGSAGSDFFETKIRPLFVENCYACHTDARMGGLQLDSREHFLKGGKSGPTAVPGDPDASLLVKALRYNASPKMPPAGKLPADQ